MAVNIDRKFCFIHVPRCGGVTIEVVLDLKNNRDGHNPYSRLINKYPDFNFHAITRNPYDRFVSAYLFFQLFDKNNPHKARYGKFKEKGMKGTVESLLKLGHYDVSALLKPQFTFICRDGEIDFEVDRFENIYEAYVKYCRELDIIPSDKLKKYNATTRKDYSYYYDEELRDLVYTYYKTDFDLFGYKK